jgi:hypothetical protein
MFWGADSHQRLIRQGADAESLSASAEEISRIVKGMERARLEGEMRTVDVLNEAQAKISRQVGSDCFESSAALRGLVDKVHACGVVQVSSAERLLRPIRAYTKGLEDLVPKADRDVLLGERDRLAQEVEALRRIEQELRAELRRAAAAHRVRTPPALAVGSAHSCATSR